MKKGVFAFGWYGIGLIGAVIYFLVLLSSQGQPPVLVAGESSASILLAASQTELLKQTHGYLVERVVRETMQELGSQTQVLSEECDRFRGVLIFNTAPESCIPDYESEFTSLFSKRYERAILTYTLVPLLLGSPSEKQLSLSNYVVSFVDGFVVFTQKEPFFIHTDTFYYTDHLNYKVKIVFPTPRDVEIARDLGTCDDSFCVETILRQHPSWKQSSCGGDLDTGSTQRFCIFNTFNAAVSFV